MDALEFNEKYKDYLDKGHYGLALGKQSVVDYLDKEFEQLIKIPGFSYSQIKGKFSWFCFYATNLPNGKQDEIETKLKELYENNV